MKITKTLKGKFIKHKLGTDTNWAVHALMAVYRFQTEDEKSGEYTSHNNNMGFTSFDAKFFSSLAQQYKTRKSLSPKQLEFVKRKIPKYWKQILTISDEKKIVKALLKDGWITQQDVEKYEGEQFLKVI